MGISATQASRPIWYASHSKPSSTRPNSGLANSLSKARRVRDRLRRRRVIPPLSSAFASSATPLAGAGILWLMSAPALAPFTTPAEVPMSGEVTGQEPLEHGERRVHSTSRRSHLNEYVAFHPLTISLQRHSRARRAEPLRLGPACPLTTGAARPHLHVPGGTPPSYRELSRGDYRQQPAHREIAHWYHHQEQQEGFFQA